MISILFFFRVISFHLKHVCFTGLCPDWEDWGPDGQRNADEAMALAEKYLGVAKVSLLLGTTKNIYSLAHIYRFDFIVCMFG